VQAQVLDLLEELQRELGLAMIFITHDLSTLTSFCGRLAVMYAGRIVEEGPARAAFRDAAHPYTKALAEAFPVIGDPHYRMHPSGLAGDPPDPRAVPAGCPFHPRCAVARTECATDAVDLWPIDAARSAACVRVLDGSWRAG
jgi:peptide/nickel transport system ATP-binding protein